MSIILRLARCQPVEPDVRSADRARPRHVVLDQPPGDLRSEERVASGDGPDGVRELARKSTLPLSVTSISMARGR
jgi:hypothetical protein